MPLAASVQKFLEHRAASTLPRIHDTDLATARRRHYCNSLLGDVPQRRVAQVDDLQIDTRNGAALAARIYYPQPPSWADPVPALLYFHAGGYVLGSIEAAEAQCRMLADVGQCAVVAVGYRRAPEHRFPCAADDAVDALLWLHREAASLAVDPARLAVCGESCGATLSVVAAFHARDAGISLATQILIYPGLSAKLDTETHRQYGRGHFLTHDVIHWIHRNYLTDLQDGEDWRFAPLDGWRNAPADWRNLAPTYLIAAEYDPLLDEQAAYATKLRSHGNEVVMHCYQGMIHGFFSMGRMIPEAVPAHADAGRVLSEAFARAATGAALTR